MMLNMRNFVLSISSVHDISGSIPTISTGGHRILNEFVLSANLILHHEGGG